MTSIINRACQTAAWPAFECRRVVLKSACMFAARGLPRHCPDLSVASFNRDNIKRSRRWSIKNVAGRGVKRTFMTGTLETLLIARVVNRTTQVSTLLPVSVIDAISGANQNRGVIARWIVEVQSTVRRQRFGASNTNRGKGLGVPRIQCRLRRETGGSKKER